jgi:hypothetical protein
MTERDYWLRVFEIMRDQGLSDLTRLSLVHELVCEYEGVADTDSAPTPNDPAPPRGAEGHETEN